MSPQAPAISFMDSNGLLLDKGLEHITRARVFLVVPLQLRFVAIALLALETNS